APYSAGSDGWYISCLQDGQRISEGLGNGWRTENRKASYVDIDLGRTLKFNRIDLYPAGSIFDYGSSFPKTLTISVSADGKTYTEVKTLSDIEIKTTKGMKVDIGEQEARYVRVDLVDPASGTRFMALNEIEIYHDDGTVPAPETFTLLKDDGTVITYKEGENIAKGKQTFYSSTTPAHYQAWGWDISYINDGKSGNGWTSNVGLNRSPNATEYVGVSFGDLFAVEKIILEDNGVFPEDFNVALSEDGLNWTIVKDVKGEPDKNSGEKYEILLDAPVNARFVRVTGTKLRGGGNDGYLLQLGEIEAYGKPVCDKTVLEEAIDTFKAEGGDETAKEFTDATAAMDNALLTQTQARDYAKKLLALVGKELETEPPVTEPDTPAETDPPEDPTDGDTDAPTDPTDPTEKPTDPVEDPTDTPDETQPEKKGCKSAIGLTALLMIGGAALLIRKKREE
ncbi:MAG: discoidin domain-containing protein, partial [Clostridia bacterium]|nr:discoidin domain-containing protein [Clostridia bacterium]